MIKPAAGRETRPGQNQARGSLLGRLHELCNGRQAASWLRELLRIILPSSWRERVRRWRTQAAFFRSSRNLWPALKKDLLSYAGRFLNSHCYRQENYGEAPLLTLLVSCDLSGAPFSALCASLKGQTWPHFELFFLLRGADHRFTQKLSVMLADKGCASWKVLAVDSSSLVEVFNLALQEAQGKYVVSLKVGDELSPTFLEKSLLLLEASPPHFFIQSLNQPFHEAGGEGLEIFEPTACLIENRFRALVFPRSAGLALAGYNESIPSGYEEWEFYVKLVRHGYVGCMMPDRVYRCSSHRPAESVSFDFALSRKRIQALYWGYIFNHERWLRRRAQQYWQVTEPLCNLLPPAGAEKKVVFWLDLLGECFEPWRLFPRLMARTEDAKIPLVVTVESRWQSFFNYNKKAGLHVYLPKEYNLQGKSADFYHYLKTSYQLKKVSVEDILQLPEPDSGSSEAQLSGGLEPKNLKLRILYVAPWLITGGADTMTVDWFSRLKSEWSEKYFVTTLFRDNSWLPKIADYAQGVYDLPALGCLDQTAMTDFLLEFIALQNIDILHIMNSEIAFHALPKLKERFPGLKVVAQFHCFDYFPDGRRTGYAFEMPPRYDHLIDRYNLEYSQLGEEIVQLNPHIESSKFKVIHGRIDSDFYNPEGRQPAAKIAGYRRKGVLNLLFIGRLDRQKQPLRLLGIANILRHQEISFVMHVIGEGNLESQKKEFLAELQRQGLAGQVLWHGEQSLVRLVDWYMVADILLLTSDWEGVPMVLYQAMAMAVVPVVAEVGGCAELVTKECGYLVAEPNNAEAYAAAIRELVDDKRRQLMASAARQRMLDHFSLVDLDREYKVFYRSLVNN